MAYVGQTTQPIVDRWRQHVSYAKIGKSGKLYEFMREFGIEFFSIHLLHVVHGDDAYDLQEKLNTMEVMYINALASSVALYNTYAGGRRSPKKYKVAKYSFDGELLQVYESQEDAAKAIGASNKGISRACVGSKKFYYGFQWRMFLGDVDYVIDKLPPPKNHHVAILQYDLGGKRNIFIQHNTRG